MTDQPRIGVRVRVPALRVAGTIAWARPIAGGGWQLGLKDDDGIMLPPISGSECMYEDGGELVCEPPAPPEPNFAGDAELGLPIDRARVQRLLRSARLAAEGRSLRGPVTQQVRDYAGLACDLHEILKGVIAGEPEARADALAIIVGRGGADAA